MNTLPNISDGPDGVTYGEYMRQRDRLYESIHHEIGTRVSMNAHLNSGEWYHHPMNYKTGEVVSMRSEWVGILFDDAGLHYIPRRYVVEVR